MKIKRYIFTLLITLLSSAVFSQSDINIAPEIIVPDTPINNIRDSFYTPGSVTIKQDVRIDSLVLRHFKLRMTKKNTISGFRIQIYSNSSQAARAKAGQIRAKFITLFPDLETYEVFDDPYFKVQIGDFRTRYDVYIAFIDIKKKFPNAYIVQGKINYPVL